MRGTDERSGSLFSYVDLEARVPKDHPLRAIRGIANGALSDLSADFAAMYAPLGRPSIAPEKLLRASLLQAFYTVRSERQLMERLQFDLLFRWFVGLGIDDAVWDHSVFSKNRDRLLEGEIAAKFMAAVLTQPNVKQLLSTDHFSVDGTLVEAWASMKSLKPKKAPGDNEPPASGGRNEEVDFRGEKRSNQTHASTSDPDAMLYRKGSGMEAKLCFIGHALMENRHGIFVETRLTRVSGHAERLAALDMIEPYADRAEAITLGGDKGFDGNLRHGTARDQRDAAHRPQHDQTFGHRRTDDPPSRLCSKSAHPQTHRRGLRLDQNHRWFEENKISRARKSRLGLHPRSRSVQSDQVAEVDRCSMSRNAARPCLASIRHRHITTSHPVPRKAPTSSTAC